MNSKKLLSKKAGIFTDPLTMEEVNFSKKAGKELEQLEWTKDLLNESKIISALNAKPTDNRSYSSLNAIKSALFEIRFAYSIYNAGLIAEYEYTAGIGDTSVDFRCTDGNNVIWLIELTSLRESVAVKENTSIGNNYFSYRSIPKKNKNSPEVIDIIKTQKAICSKVVNNKGTPIKFPSVQPNCFHMIVVDMRSFNAGISDCYDYHNIAYGSKSLIDKHDGIYCRRWIDQSNATESYISGLFDEQHPDIKSQYVRERIHVLGFILEKKYSKNELKNNIKFFCNPNLCTKQLKITDFL